MPSRRLAVAALPALLLLATAPSAAQQVYKWTDANGVPHYSGTPPENVDYQSRTLSSRDPVLPAEDAPSEDPVCQVARENIALLDGDSPLQVDTDGDGEPDKTLTEAERADRRALAEATLRVECAPRDDAPPADPVAPTVGT